MIEVICTIQYYSHLQRNEILIYAVNMSVMFNEIKDIKTQIYNSMYINYLEEGIHRDRK